MRRLVVLAVVGAVIVGLVAIVRSAVGDDTSSAASTSVPGSVAETLALDATSTTAASAATGDASLVVTDPNATTTLVAPTAPVDSNTVPTAADPARVLLVGDSEAGGLSPFLQKVIDATGVVSMTTDYKVSSGLVRPDFFDWPAHMRETLPITNPDIVVALFGGNDGQSFIDETVAAAGKPVDSPEWRAEYGKRVSDMMDLLSADGRTLIWVGVPNAEKEEFTARLSVLNDVVKEQVAAHPNVKFVDSWHAFIGLDGKSFAQLVLDPRDGEFKEVRSQTDGFHLNTDGEGILAFYVAQAVTAELVARGAQIAAG